jgi:hypothetical protein
MAVPNWLNKSSDHLPEIVCWDSLVPNPSLTIQQLLEYRLENWKWMQKFVSEHLKKESPERRLPWGSIWRARAAAAQARILFPRGLGGGDGQPFYLFSLFACFASDILVLAVSLYILDSWYDIPYSFDCDICVRTLWWTAKPIMHAWCLYEAERLRVFIIQEIKIWLPHVS